MQYKFAMDSNFEDFASGRVFYTIPGTPAFPVRLASEIFQRCRAHWQATGGEGLCTIYDPTCGGAYWLGVLGFLLGEYVSKIYASDIDETVIPLAERNLSLLKSSGITLRVAEIERMLTDYGKRSHKSALESAKRLQNMLSTNTGGHEISTRVFQADFADPKVLRQIFGESNIDILMADVPYGLHSIWSGGYLGGNPNPIGQILDSIISVCSPQSVLAIASDKIQKINHSGFKRLERFQVGKRRIEILQRK
jgi:tRNA G10  N-methylase Trm11